MDPKKMILKSRIAPKVCNACGGDLRPVNELFMKDGLEAYEKFKQGFKEQSGMDWKESPNWVCILCGLIYDEEFNNTGNVIQWFPALRNYYG